MSARDRVLARKREEQARKEDQRRKELAAAAHAAVADRMFAQQKEAEQYRGTGIAKVSVVVQSSGVSPSPSNILRVSTADGGAPLPAPMVSAPSALRLPGSRYALDDSLVDGEEEGEYGADGGVQYSLAGGPSGVGGPKPHRTPRKGALVMPGAADPHYVVAGGEDRAEGGAAQPSSEPGYSGDDFSDIDSDEDDMPMVEEEEEGVPRRKRGPTLPDDDTEIDAVEEQLQHELGVCPPPLCVFVRLSPLHTHARGRAPPFAARSTLRCTDLRSNIEAAKKAVSFKVCVCLCICVRVTCACDMCVCDMCPLTPITL